MSAARKSPKHGTRTAPTRRAIPGALADRECRAAVCPDGKSELMLHDGASLYLRVRRSGRKVWVYLYGSGKGRVRVAHPVPYPTTSLAAARTWAATQRDLVRTNAADPVQVSRAERAALAVARTQTLGGMLECVWEDMRERGQPSWVGTRSAAGHLPEWARQMQPVHITRDHAEQILREVREATPGTRVVREFKSRLSAAYSRADIARAGTNPKRLNAALAAYGVRENPFKSHSLGIPVGVGDQHFSREEAQEFTARLLREEPSDARDLLLLVLYLGGQRCVQMAGARITVEKETQAPCLLLLDAKQKGDTPRPHVLPLQGPALELLAARGMLREGDAIFGVDYAGSYQLAKLAGNLCERIRKQWRREAAARNVPFTHFSKKVLRSTASTGMASIDIPEATVNLVLSHGQKSVDWKHYNRWEYLERKRAALAQWQRWLEEPAPAPELAADAGKVVPLRRAA